MLSDLRLAARYEARIARRAIAEAWSAVRGTWRSIPGLLLKSLCAVALAAVGYGAFKAGWDAVVLALLVGASSFLVVLLWKIATLPARLDAEAKQAIVALEGDIVTQEIEDKTLELISALYDEGVRLRDGISGMSSKRVAEWRRRTAEALPFERYAFLKVCTDEMHARSTFIGQADLHAAQVEKLRHILMRIENQVDARRHGRAAMIVGMHQAPR